MTEFDPVLHGLGALATEEPPAQLSRALRSAAHARLVPVRVHPGWSVAVAATVLAYLSWALLYTSQL